MESTMHNVVSVVIGKIRTQTNAVCRDLVITRSNGERLIVTMFGDCKQELRVIEIAEDYPSHFLPSKAA